MITCTNCGHLNEQVKFCSNCGTELNEEVAASNEAVTQTGTSSNETTDKLKATSQNYGKFFLEYLKQPSLAKNTTEKDFINGLITIGAFVLIATILTYVSLSVNNPLSGLGIDVGPSFMDAFVKPLISDLILYAVIPVLIFGVYFYFIGKRKNIQLFYAKFGAYLIPFAVVFVAGEIFSMLGIGVIAYITTMIGSTGIMLIIPTLILFEEDHSSSKGLDKIYALFIAIAAILLVSYLLGNMFSATGSEYMNFFNMFN